METKEAGREVAAGGSIRNCSGRSIKSVMHDTLDLPDFLMTPRAVPNCAANISPIPNSHVVGPRIIKRFDPARVGASHGTKANFRPVGRAKMYCYVKVLDHRPAKEFLLDYHADGHFRGGTKGDVVFPGALWAKFPEWKQ